MKALERFFKGRGLARDCEIFVKVRFKLYIRFCESLLDMLTELHGGEFGGIVDNGMNDVRIIGCGTVFVLLIIAIVGMEWITRVQAVLLVLLIFSQVNCDKVFTIFKLTSQTSD